MRFLSLTIALTAGAMLVAYAARSRFAPLASTLPALQAHLSAGAPTEPAAERAADLTQSPAATYAAAKALAWEAAVMVQQPPHPVETWKAARRKWRQAIRLLESIPPHSALGTAAAARLTRYRQNQAAIDQRLADEQTALENLQEAQSLAWQAAVIVQDPPHPLHVWQHAQSKWQAAIALLEPIAPTTSVASQTQQKLATYRSNQGSIRQRIGLEQQAQALTSRFGATSRELSALSTRGVSGLTIEQIGIDYADYVALVQSLDADLRQFAAQPGGATHPIYAPLSAAISDYRFALDLWNTYLRYKQANSQWLYDDLFNQLVPLAWIDSMTLFQKYQVKPHVNGTKVSLRCSVWAVWHHADDRIRQVQTRWLSQAAAPAR